MNKALDYQTFVRKRFVQIYLPYILVVLISALISEFLPVYDNSLYALGGHVFLYKMFDEKIIGSYGYQLWFISMILQFYLTFHVIVWLRSKLTAKVFLLSSALVSICWALLVCVLDKENERIWNSFFLQYYWEFALGMIIAERAFRKQKLIADDVSKFYLLAFGAINCALYAFIALRGGQYGKLFNDFFALAGYSFIAIFIFKLNIKPIKWFFLFVGEISLSVYLLHTLVLLTTYALLRDFSPVISVLISFVLLVPISASYQVVANWICKIGTLKVSLSKHD